MNEHSDVLGVGPNRTLPHRRVHELLEEEARAPPNAIAAMYGDRQLTYRELNARANQVARALVARRLSREGVVGVVTERNLDWMTAVLAIFKAGGTYLPIEPHFPADRIARMLSRAGCRLVLTERGSSAMLDQAVHSCASNLLLQVQQKVLGNLSPSGGESHREVETLFIDAAYDEGYPDSD